MFLRPFGSKRAELERFCPYYLKIMVNFYDKNRFISKSELAKFAGVSYSTFKRYLRTRQHILSQMGITPKTQKLPPQAVHYICEDYCIDLPLELQDQEFINKSPIYQQFIRHLQDAEYYKLMLKCDTTFSKKK